MTTVHSPTAGRRRLRSALRSARDAAGYTQDQVAERMDWSLSKVIRIETGAVSISISDLRQLLQLYRVDQPTRVAELVELARVGRQRPWWTQYKDSVPGDYLSYVGLEDECGGLRTFQPVGLHGLLQTEEYARASLAAHRAPRPDIEDRVDVRMTRQEKVLRREEPPEITVVLDESVLWREIGGVEMLRRQLLHLVRLGSNPHIILRVLPFTASQAFALSPFVILEFPDPADPDVVYIESALETTVIDKPVEVAKYHEVFEWVRSATLSEEDTLAKIADVAGRLR